MKDIRTPAESIRSVLRAAVFIMLACVLACSGLPMYAIAEVAEDAPKSSLESEAGTPSREASDEGDESSGGDGSDGAGAMSDVAQNATSDSSNTSVAGMVSDEPSEPSNADSADVDGMKSDADMSASATLAELANHAAIEVTSAAELPEGTTGASKDALLVRALFVATVSCLSTPDGSLADESESESRYRALLGNDEQDEVPAFPRLRELISTVGKDEGGSGVLLRVLEALQVDCQGIEGADGARWVMVCIDNLWYHVDVEAAVVTIAAVDTSTDPQSMRDAAFAWLLATDGFLLEAAPSRVPWMRADEGDAPRSSESPYSFAAADADNAAWSEGTSGSNEEPMLPSPESDGRAENEDDEFEEPAVAPGDGKVTDEAAQAGPQEPPAQEVGPSWSPGGAEEASSSEANQNDASGEDPKMGNVCSGDSLAQRLGIVGAPNGNGADSSNGVLPSSGVSWNKYSDIAFASPKNSGAKRSDDGSSIRLFAQGSISWKLHVWVSHEPMGEQVSRPIRIGDTVYVNYEILDGYGNALNPGDYGWNFTATMYFYRANWALIGSHEFVNERANWGCAIYDNGSDAETAYARVAISGDIANALEVGWEVYDTVPNITIQPSSQSAYSGSTRTFHVSATGTHLQYQWYCKTPSGNTTAVNGATSNSIVVTASAANSGSQYYCRLYNRGNEIYTSNATLTTLYNVSYNANGGSGAPSSQTKTHGSALTLSSSTPTRSYVVTYDAAGGSVSPTSKTVGCTFRGWNTQSSGGGIWYSAGGSYAENASATLYAQWANPTVGTLATPTRAGYSFDGWYTSASGGTRVTTSTTVTGNMTIYAHWGDPYNLGDETYSFKNYEDEDDPRGHCLGMSMTSAGYHTGVLDMGIIGGSPGASLYGFSDTPIVKRPICYYQAIQGPYVRSAIVAGGSYDLSNYRYADIDADWSAVVNYVSGHSYDGAGRLVFGYWKGWSGHAIVFLRYERVGNQDRLYAYDNNFPDQETYFYRDDSGRVMQAPKQTFSGAIDSIELIEVSSYFSAASQYDLARALYMDRNAAVVNDYQYYEMRDGGSDSERVMYVIPANASVVTIDPSEDNASFVYMGVEYQFGEVTSNTRGKLEFGSQAGEAYGDDPSVPSVIRKVGAGLSGSGATFTIYEANSAMPSVTLSKTVFTYNGKTLRPTVSVKVGGAVLTEGRDYTVVYPGQSVDVGTYELEVKLRGGYSGSVYKTYSIVKSTQTPTKTFPDVPANAWYADVVSRAAGLGLINGYNDGRFGPNDRITRGQVAVVLWNMAGGPAAGSGAKSFPDVKSADYFYRAVRWASSAGVVSGYANGKFGPNDNVTREQLAVMIANYAMNVAGRQITGSASDFSSMSDRGKVSSWAVSSVGWCFKNKILSGSNGKILPRGNATRAEAAKMVVGLYDLLA